MAAEIEIPATKRAAIVSEFGDKGRAWIDKLPDLIARCVDRWGLTLTETVPGGLPANLVFFGENDAGLPIAMKVGCPHPELFTEMIALRRYRGRHAVNLIDAGEDLGAILMERVLPGTPFRHIAGNPERSRIRIELFDKLPIRVNGISGLPTFDDWVAKAFREFRQGSAPNAEFAGFIEMAEDYYAGIRERFDADWLIHGDLHHENILLDENRGWVAIDPKGVIAPKVMESGRYLHNFIVDEIPDVDSLADAGSAAIAKVLRERFVTFSDMLGISRRDLMAVTWIDLILSTCWALNSNGDATDGIHIARVLRSMPED